MPARSTHLIFHNKTPFLLSRTDGGLNHGVFTDPFSFVDRIAPGTTVDWETESDGVATGTEGFVKYQIGDGSSGVHIHWDNPFSGTNKYNEFVADGFELFHTGGVGNNTIVDFTLAQSVPHRVAGFRPSRSGFQFVNRFTDLPLAHIDLGVATIPIGNAANGMCGGMMFAVRDYFEANQLPPQNTTAPTSENDPLFGFLDERLIKSFDLPDGPTTFLRLMDPAFPDTDENILNPIGLAGGRAFVMAREEWPKIKADIDGGHLSEIALVQVRSLLPTDLGENHQVVVYGYELSGSTVTLHVHDPNDSIDASRDHVTFSLNIGFTDRVIDVQRRPAGAHPIICFFRENYSFRSPPLGVLSVRLFLERRGADPARGIRAQAPDPGVVSVRALLAH
jgi:hypothetical protein